MLSRAWIVALALLCGGCAVWHEPRPALLRPAPDQAEPVATEQFSKTIPIINEQRERGRSAFDPNAPELFTCIDGARLEVRYSPDRAIARVGLNGGALVALRRVEQEAYLSYVSHGVQFLRSGPRAVYKNQSASVIVRRGDTLGAIAMRLYGDRSRGQEIAHINAEQVANPDMIYPGQVLRLPDGERRCRRTLI